MGEGRAVVCFQCGRSVGEPPVLNELPDGGNCPACAERLLESLPPIFPVPSPGFPGAPVPEEYEEYEGREDGSRGYEDGGEPA